MRVLITGANGFIGRNLQLHLAERKDLQLVFFNRGDSMTLLRSQLLGVDFIFHLAGVNRPHDPNEFKTGNLDLTQALCEAVGEHVAATGHKIPVLYSSSIQATNETPYGASKHAAERALLDLQSNCGIPVHIFRLPNVFGKWCKPNYNSAVATFCHNIARDLPVQVHEASAALTLVYVDDLLLRFIQLMDGADRNLNSLGFETVSPQYTSTVGKLAEQIAAFRESRANLITERVGAGLVRALYSTYLSYLPPSSFSYQVPQHRDPRGVFVEMLKTPDCGQFSFFSAHPGVTRGGHYHHSKTEKFLVIKGKARFKFRHMLTDERHELITSGDRAEVVETVPGWTHDITNVGDEEMLVMLWANEIFNRSNPDTIACSV